MARILLTTALSHEDDVPNTTQLLTLTLLLIAWAELREARRLVHQAHAAREAAERLPSWNASAAAPPPDPPAPGLERYRTERPVRAPRGHRR